MPGPAGNEYGTVMNKTLTHKELVKMAKNWLFIAKQCNPVFAEKGSSKTSEMPDVIGWSSQGSMVVECKVSLTDFRSDAKKAFRRNPDIGMGKYRYYLFTKELYDEIPKEELPEGWGICLEDYNFHRVGQVRFKGSKEWVHDVVAELYYLRNRVLEIQNFGK